MVEEAYVSFEIAKLLKEKGFDELCYQKYDDEGYLSFNHIGYINGDKFSGDFYALAPTQQMAIAWLREVHNLFIEIQCYGCEYDEKAHFEYSFVISEYVKIDTKNCRLVGLEKRNAKSQFLSYGQAVETAIKYCLEHLI